nr:MAG TPA: hypothetical protein [Caudoviricetes sp.]
MSTGVPTTGGCKWTVPVQGCTGTVHKINACIFLGTGLIPVFFPCQKCVYFSNSKINTVFSCAKNKYRIYFQAGQRVDRGMWTKWTEVCPLGRKKVA